MSTAVVKYERSSYVDKFGNRIPARVVKRRVSSKKKSSSKKSSSKRKRSTSKKKWFSPKVSSGWRKDLPAKVRRRLLLRAHKGDRLAAARSKIALANVTKDKETREVARADAEYFLREYKKLKKGD